ncbi:MAG: hypothetical protein IMF17_05380, partial [Proteobacteria bacterium]|nr:hypothetical protein [Pseudomonadota bacterium]
RENSVNTDISNKKTQIIHHIQISTRYNPANARQTVARQQQISSEREKHRPHISEKTAELLSQSANSMSHQPLKTALLRVARHGKPDDSNPVKKK